VRHLKSYTENQIREAFREAESVILRGGKIRLSAEEVIWQLARGSDVHAIWADSDTVTVKELREAGSRVPVSDPDPLASILRDISEHREPEYPPASVWEDDNGVRWQRTSNEMWLRMGRVGEFSHGYPKRPLKRMGVV
jgi:hypothetical protein